jgi:hypothetical protein
MYAGSLLAEEWDMNQEIFENFKIRKQSMAINDDDKNGKISFDISRHRRSPLRVCHQPAEEDQQVQIFRT